MRTSASLRRVPSTACVLALVRGLTGSAGTQCNSSALPQLYPAGSHNAQSFSYCKHLYFVRHAEAWHNKDGREDPLYRTGPHMSPRYRDARLTPHGELQSAGLRTQLEQTDPQIELVVVSSLSRAILTAELSFGQLTPRPRFICTELCRERISVFTCDQAVLYIVRIHHSSADRDISLPQRRTRSELKIDFPLVDFSLLENEDDGMWALKENTPSELDSDLATVRSKKFVEFLWKLPEKRIGLN